MAIIIEAPNEVYSLENQKNVKLFLAGSITDCPDWQSQVIKQLKDVEGLTIFNPRRKDFPMGDPTEAEKQIVWEYNHLKEADVISFWFDKGSLGPITLYELGRWANSSDKKLICVGMDLEYKRKQDVEIQTRLSKPDTRFSYTILSLVDDIERTLHYVKLVKSTNDLSL